MLGGTDIDILISLTSTLSETLQSIYDTLFNALSQAGYAARRQNVSIGIAVGGWKVDVTPGRRQDQYGNYHSLCSNKTGSWLQTNINEHIRVVSGSGRIDEIRLMKIWRNRFGLDWPRIFYKVFDELSRRLHIFASKPNVSSGCGEIHQLNYVALLDAGFI